MRERSGLWVLAAVLLASLCATAGGRAANETQLLSPDGSLGLKVFVQEARLKVAVSLKKEPVIEPSSLVLSVDGVDLTEGPELGDVTPYQVKETYPWHGAHSQAVNHCNGATVRLKHAKSGAAYTLDVRAFSDGVGFRWVVPGDKEARVPDEATAFVLPAGSTVWYHDLRGHYEGVHEKKRIEDVRAGEWA